MLSLANIFYSNVFLFFVLLTFPTSLFTAAIIAEHLRGLLFPSPAVSDTEGTTRHTSLADPSVTPFRQRLWEVKQAALWIASSTVVWVAYVLLHWYIRHYLLARVGSSASIAAIKRLLRRLMGYDPANPATWSIAQLRNYATEHGITIPSGCEKSELIALVDDRLTDELLAEHIRSENALDAALLPDILAVDPGTILHHVAYPSYAKTLRQNPAKLQALIDAGLAQLQSLPCVARLCSAQLHSPLEAWLGHVILAEDNGRSFKAAVTPAAGAAVASAVCGRLCGDNEMIIRCLDCGADPTCVMCMDCFRHSPCVNHRYRITHGSGSGMCDCGDPTAWKPESFCSRHRGISAADGATAADPLASLAEEDRAWVMVVLRGIVQFISLSVLQSLRIAEVQKKIRASGGLKKKDKKEVSPPGPSSGRGKHSGKDKGSAAPCTAAAAAPVDPEVALMEDVARIGASYDWLSSWLNTVTQELWDLISTTEVAKHLVAQLWTEPLHLRAEVDGGRAAESRQSNEEEEEEAKAGSAGTASRRRQRDAVLAALPDAFTCLHPIFLHQAARPVTAHEQPMKATVAEGPWRLALARCIGHCLSDPKLRLPVGALMATYAECLNAHDPSSSDRHNPLQEYQVQVLTNPDVIRHLMTPAHMPYRNATNTVVHRTLSSILYSLCVASDRETDNAISRTAAVDRDGLFFMEHQSRYLSFGGTTVLHYSITGSTAACFTLVLSRLAWRALAQINGTLAISGYICADPDAPTDASKFPSPDFFARMLSRHTWLWFHAMRVVMSTLLKLPPATGADADAAAMPPIDPAAFTAALQLPPEMWRNWQRATRFDSPPDTSRRRKVFLQVLDSCTVRGGTADALLVLQRGPAASALAAALQEHGDRAATSSSSSSKNTTADASPVMPAAVASAVGYAVQVLYEISRTMDAVFQKQRDGFCRRCTTPALVRESRPGTAAAAADTSQQAEAGDEEAEAAAAAAAAAAVDSEKDSDDAEAKVNEEEGEGEKGEAVPTLPPSSSPIDVLEYNLLDPARHATTFSNHLPRMFGTVLTAWVIEQRRHGEAEHRQQSRATGPSTRLTGLCEGDTTTTTTTTRSGNEAEAGSPVCGPAGPLARPLHTLLDCFFRFRSRVLPVPAHDRLAFCQQLLDSLVMPQVLTGQVLDGLWRRDNYGVSAAMAMYLAFSRSVAAEFDVLMLQVLTLELAPADMALQMLRRFSYAKQSYKARKKAERANEQQTSPRRHTSKPHSPHHATFRKYLAGYKYYLRLMLTLVVDTTKASFHPPLSSLCVERTVAHLLARNKASHSAIIQSVSDAVRSGDFGDAEEDEKDASGNVIKFTQVIDQAIKKLAVGQDSAHGKQFRLRDLQTWRANVCLYQSSILDSQLEEVHTSYRSIALASRADKQKTAANTAEAEGAAEASAPISLPPTQLPGSAMHPELVPTTRALLHTDAFLLPALYVLHEYTNAHAPPPPPSSSSPAGEEPHTTHVEDLLTTTAAVVHVPPPDGLEGMASDTADSAVETASSSSSTAAANDHSGDDSDDDDDDDEDTNLITREALLHAVTALYLCVQDCRDITRAMQAAEDGQEGPADAPPTAISWDLVELYLHRFRVNESSFTADSCAPVLPLPELVRHRTLLHKLRSHVALHCPATTTAKVTAVSVTSADMLHRLRTYLQANEDADTYSCLEMVEEVLVLTGLATFDTAAASAEQKAKEEAAQSRKKLIQERQAKLMLRMRSRVLKTAVDTDAAPTAAETVSAPGVAAAPHGTAAASSTSNVTGSLLTKMLLELATVDCCVCRAATEEPLFLLCHTGTSDVLRQLGAVVLPDDRPVHGHLALCGHAAHKTCVEKLFVRLSVLWQRWNFRSQFYLGPTEFNCPVCNMIVTTLAPMPSLSTGAVGQAPSAAGAAPMAAVSLFEELQAGSVHTNSSDRTEDVAGEFQTNLANSAIGFSPSEDIPPIVSAEDPLQQSDAAAWLLSETMRTFFHAAHVMLESVKVGQPIGHRDLLSLLALLVSIVPAKLRAAQAALRDNYHRTKSDQDSLLLLEVLLQPREAAQRIRDDVLSSVLAGLSDSYLRQLLACLPPTRSGEGSAAPAVDEAAVARLESANTMTLWKALGVRTLLKALLVEDAHHATVFGSGSFTVAGTVELTTLSAQGIESAAAQCTSVLRMLAYLLPVTAANAAEAEQMVSDDLQRCLQSRSGVSEAEGEDGTPMLLAMRQLRRPTLPFTSAEGYVAGIAEYLMHLPRVYATVLTDLAEHKLCSVCHKESKTPAMCCRCGRHLCVTRQHSGETPELYAHIRTCGGAVGLFLLIRQASFYVLELTSGRLYPVLSNYTDEYGERDRNLRRGVPLFRNAEETQRLVALWLQNKWGAVSAVFANSNRIDLTEL